MDLIILNKTDITVPEMLDPVATSISEFWRKVSLNNPEGRFIRLYTTQVQITDLLELARHQPYAISSYGFMCPLLVYPKLLIAASLIIEEEVTE